MNESEQTKTPFAHKKSLGQNFLTSDVVPRWLAEAGEVTDTDTVLEIGPGTGRLTAELLARGARVIAIEADERACVILKETFADALKSEHLTLFHGDARVITPATLNLKDKDFKVIANIPYYLSGHLLRLLLEASVQPKTLVFLMQKELVERIARAKKSSLIALGVAAFGTPRYVKTVARGHFYPMPNVDSAILAVTNISQNNFSDIEASHFFALLHLGLGKKRKQLLNNLSDQYKKELLLGVFEELGLSLKVRGEDLPLSTWLDLARALPKGPII